MAPSDPPPSSPSSYLPTPNTPPHPHSPPAPVPLPPAQTPLAYPTPQQFEQQMLANAAHFVQAYTHEYNLRHGQPGDTNAGDANAGQAQKGSQIDPQTFVPPPGLPPSQPLPGLGYFQPRPYGFPAPTYPTLQPSQSYGPPPQHAYPLPPGVYPPQTLYQSPPAQYAPRASPITPSSAATFVVPPTHSSPVTPIVADSGARAQAASQGNLGDRSAGKGSVARDCAVVATQGGGSGDRGPSLEFDASGESGDVRDVGQVEGGASRMNGGFWVDKGVDEAEAEGMSLKTKTPGERYQEQEHQPEKSGRGRSKLTPFSPYPVTKTRHNRQPSATTTARTTRSTSVMGTESAPTKDVTDEDYATVKKHPALSHLAESDWELLKVLKPDEIELCLSDAPKTARDVYHIGQSRRILHTTILGRIQPRPCPSCERQNTPCIALDGGRCVRCDVQHKSCPLKDKNQKMPRTRMPRFDVLFKGAPSVGLEDDLQEKGVSEPGDGTHSNDNPVPEEEAIVVVPAATKATPVGKGRKRGRPSLAELAELTAVDRLTMESRETGMVSTLGDTIEKTGKGAGVTVREESPDPLALWPAFGGDTGRSKLFEAEDGSCNASYQKRDLMEGDSGGGSGSSERIIETQGLHVTSDSFSPSINQTQTLKRSWAEQETGSVLLWKRLRLENERRMAMGENEKEKRPFQATELDPPPPRVYQSFKPRKLGQQDVFQAGQLGIKKLVRYVAWLKNEIERRGAVKEAVVPYEWIDGVVDVVKVAAGGRQQRILEEVLQKFEELVQTTPKRLLAQEEKENAMGVIGKARRIVGWLEREEGERRAGSFEKMH